MKAQLEAWFAEQGWAPLAFQRRTWRHYLAGRSGLLHAPTGSGKTLAVWGGPLLAAAGHAPRPRGTPRLRHLWITPLRALAADTVQALQAPLPAMGLDWRVGLRTGDASARDKRIARRGEVDVLVTTPESLALLLSHADTAPVLAGLEGVVVDEWHEFLGTKRGVLLELCLARLRGLQPALRVWGLSATLGNLEQARDVLLPHVPEAPLVHGVRRRRPDIETLLPASGERFAWAGHLGLGQLGRVVQALGQARTSLLFTNTRSQAELWHQALASVWMEDPATLAIHHGSLDPKMRRQVEQALGAGTLRCVVATSSLDLGVDFPAVDQVLQIGSPRGIARLLQRAGRSGHQPDGRSRILCVPTHALELLEFAAAREALRRGDIESRLPLRLALDVLAQHLVTRALGGGFIAADMLAEARATHAFADLDGDTFATVLEFTVQGGAALSSYPDFQRLERDEGGMHVLGDRRQALRHRMSIGTILSDGSVQVRFLKGGRLGTVEEGFISRLAPGARFAFAGRTLELVRFRDMTAWVRLAPGGRAGPTRWMGARMPLSGELGEEVRRIVADPGIRAPEIRAAAPILALQARLSVRPALDELLVETLVRRQQRYLMLYPFAGRQVHEGLAALLALRWGRREANSFSYAVNDYGLVLVTSREVDVDEALLTALLGGADLLEELQACMNLGELSRRQFREVARISGLVGPTLPGRAAKTLRQLQASSGLIFDVLQQHDPGHVMLEQARRDVLESSLEVARLRATLERMAGWRLRLQRPKSLTPLGFPLWAESFRGSLSTEDWSTRVARAAAQLERRFR